VEGQQPDGGCAGRHSAGQDGTAQRGRPRRPGPGRSRGARAAQRGPAGDLAPGRDPESVTPAARDRACPDCRHGRLRGLDGVHPPRGAGPSAGRRRGGPRRAAPSLLARRRCSGQPLRGRGQHRAQGQPATRPV
ncbi:MAG: hypothetical protein AVDCRST_MAG07-136, partial [uncultured Frankineae bacterium]